jgi:xylose isomerase
MKSKYAVGLWAFESPGDRFVIDGYRKGQALDDVIQIISKAEKVSGVELNYPSSFFDDLPMAKGKLSQAGLSLVMIGADVTCKREWANGALSSIDEEIRKKAVKIFHETMDVAAVLDCPCVNLWLGQDGYDYIFQVDYSKSWTRLLKSVDEIVRHRNDVKISIEYKQKEPRTHTFIATVEKALYIVKKVGADNLGVTIDVGHALNAYENVAESASLLISEGKLFHMHFNDNYRLWDDDMIVGTVHFWEYIELIYYLKRAGYDGYLSLDIFPYREDPLSAVIESIEQLELFSGIVDRIGLPKFEELLAQKDIAKVFGFLRKQIFI